MLKEMIMPQLLWEKMVTNMIVNSLPLAVNIITIEKELKLLFHSKIISSFFSCKVYE